MRTLGIGLMLGCVLVGSAGDATAEATVQLVQDDAGWKLTVDGEDFFVKATQWAYTPIGHNYEYGFWSRDPELVRRVVDRYGRLMQAAGINAIRTSPDIPPEMVTYLCETYGIYTIVNDFVGRYGIEFEGQWTYPTDYGRPDVRAMLVAQAEQTVRKYRGVKGLLLFAWGNENNYALHWQRSVEDLPVEESERDKAVALYGFFEQVLRAAKRIDPDTPMLIANGDLQYLDVIAAQCPSMDILGTNMYRGRTFTDAFERVRDELGKPLLFTEFGADAYNVADEREDQVAQAYYLKDQWRHLYEHAYGAGGAGTALGGSVFEWVDEWWKHGEQHELERHNTDASWANAAYPHDFVDGRNNMNEEWWGLCALSPVKVEGVHVVVPRTAYYVLQAVWRADPFDMSDAEREAHFDAIEVPVPADVEAVSR